jgi:hypothetical protein
LPADVFADEGNLAAFEGRKAQLAGGNERWRISNIRFLQEDEGLAAVVVIIQELSVVLLFYWY